MRISPSFLSLVLAGSSLCAGVGAAPDPSDRNPATGDPDGPAQQGKTSPATPPPPAQSLTEASSEQKPPAEAGRVTGEATRFKALDTDADGRISRAEFTLAPNQPIEEVGSAAGNREGIKKPWWSRKSASQNASATTDSNIGTPTNTAEVFEQLDSDKDGFLSRVELAAEVKGR
jgi:hypothetical protein